MGKRLLLKVIAAAFFSSAALAGNSPQITVDLYDLVFVSGGRVILGQIAELRGEPKTLERVKDLQIGTVMKRKESRIVTTEEIRRALPDDVEVAFTGAPAVEVLPTASMDQYCDAAPALQRRFAALAGDSITVTVACADSNAKLDGSGLPPVQYRILSQGLLFPGQQVASLERRDASGQISRSHVSVEVQLYARLAFALKHIPRGQVIKAEDLSVRTVDLKTTGLTGLLYQPSCVIGWEATRHISPDSPLRWDQVQPPAVVHKGEGVRLVLGSKNVQIKATATALEPGYPGQKIWVRLEDNGKRLRATVVDGGCVMAE